ncbi:MAG: maleylpyruvate isomerase family mycothiol-dependent enzyme [Acidimicrobiales bacterium]|nr:maleylpyruvate isomerase family mycothiol-dependent enzyme [Acidimicrobiales bacterium]
MNAMTAIDLNTVRPIERPEATTLAETEVARFASMLRSLAPADWTRPTDCPLWDVRAMAGHVLGMTETFTGLRPFATTMRAGGKRAGDGPFVDGLTAVQVDANAQLTNDELLRRLDTAGPKAARWRARRRLMRRIPMKEEVDGVEETWRMGYLVDIILTRDTWMHRTDGAKATGTPLELTAEHDGRVVADAAAEWGRRHGQPCTLHLTGPAGGTYAQGAGGEEITIDAIDFCRILSGRGTGEGLLRQQVPF